jgi:chaperonin GroES
MVHNTTGICPTEYNVLVKLEKATDQTASGLYLPDSKRERDQGMQTRGVLIAVSPLAFNYEASPSFVPPSVGDRVIIAKGAGVFIDDLGDGEFYRLIKDKDVCAVISDKFAQLDDDIAVMNKGAAHV